MSQPARQARYFEDYPVGLELSCGPIDILADDIISFAQRYDPQPFHTDPVAARESVFQGLIASGWQTVALTMRQLVESYLDLESSLGSPGVDELRWLRPVRPGDALSVRLVVQEARRSRSKPDRGLVASLIETRNQHGEPVMTMRAMNLVLLRNPDAASA